MGSQTCGFMMTAAGPRTALFAGVFRISYFFFTMAMAIDAAIK